MEPINSPISVVQNTALNDIDVMYHSDVVLQVALGEVWLHAWLAPQQSVHRSVKGVFVGVLPVEFIG